MCSKVDIDPKGNAWVIDWYVIIMMKTIPVMIVRFLQWLCIFCVNSSPIPKFQRGINSETLALSQIECNVVRNKLFPLALCMHYFHNIITECEEQPHAINYCHCTYIVRYQIPGKHHITWSMYVLHECHRHEWQYFLDAKWCPFMQYILLWGCI